MKQYTKPTATIVELTVKESIAALPNALVQGTVSTATINSQEVILTTYNLAAASTSDAAV